MKKFLSLALSALVLAGLLGCKFSASREDLVTFYYLRADDSYTQGQEDGVIAPEVREFSAHQGNLAYLLTQYLRGPQDSRLASPFPSGTVLRSVEEPDGEQTMIVTLNTPFAQLKDMDLTIACTCLARTCFKLSDAGTVLIRTDADPEGFSLSITMTRDSFLLTDTIPETTPTE